MMIPLKNSRKKLAGKKNSEMENSIQFTYYYIAMVHTLDLKRVHKSIVCAVKKYNRHKLTLAWGNI